jgi:DNA topoisomerase VI subunit B
MPPTLARTTFQTSRLLEFFSEKELAMQIGFPKEQWPLALLKELLDNALDACETASILPDIEVTLEPNRLSVRDHGPGLPVKTLKRSLNYLVRVSDKAHYVSPSRGQLGNALKCLWAAPYVVHGDAGSVEITTGGITHRVAVTLDRIAQQPDLHHLPLPDGVVKKGTLVQLIWPGIAGCLDLEADPTFYKSAATLVEEYAAFNPHLQVTYREPAYEMTLPRTTSNWHKWAPRDPTSPHWYTLERLQGLIAAYVAEERRGGRVRTVREFVAEFAGLSGSLKPPRVIEAAGLTARTYLHDLVDDGEVALEPVTALLAVMQRESRAVKPVALGVLGEAHVRAYLTTHGHVNPETLKYHKVQGEAEGVPFVLELACGMYTDDASERAQRTIVGVNWTPALKPPFPALQSLLGEARVDSFDPVAVLVHLAMPRVDFTDRGKSAVALPVVVREALARGMAAVTKPWKALKKQSDREDRVRQRDIEHYLKQQQRQYLNVKQAVYQVMEAAYLEASAQGRLPANGRQIMYAARPKVQALTGGKSWKKSSYFTQKLLPRFLEDHPELTAAWDVVFDDRGHFVEPHTEHRIGLGTLAVRQYIGQWHAKLPGDEVSMALEHDYPTRGPANRYRFALFVEKEGFNPLLEAERIAQRYDLAIMSTKGMSVTAARQLVEQLSAHGVTILVLHDFDKSGFSIVHTLQSDTRRYTFKTRPKMIDLGLRLADVHAMGLASERVDYEGQIDPRMNLRACGATEEECQYLVRQGGAWGWIGQRVELNAMTSDQFIAWLERKLAAEGVKKVAPNRATLAHAYRRAVRQARVQEAIDAALADLEEEGEIAVPNDLAEQLRETLDGSAKSWDQVLWDLVHPEDAEDTPAEAQA